MAASIDIFDGILTMANKIPAFLLIALGVVVFVYGGIQMQSGGTVAPLGIGAVGAVFGVMLLIRKNNNK